MALHATLWPRGTADDGVTITVYVVTGHHGIFHVPASFCRECHLFTRAAEEAAKQVDTPVDVRVVSWWTRFPWALRHGGYHPPVLVIGDERVAQGEEVPTVDDIIAAIEGRGER